jgi:pimeloyl-ACP methyl ester carboxylesterase
MRRGHRAIGTVAAFATALVALLAVLAASAQAQERPGRAGALRWTPCGVSDPDSDQTPDVFCATLTVPKDYSHPAQGTVSLAIARSPVTDPRERIGSLFLNFGGPGGTAVDTLQATGSTLFPNLNRRFDVIGFDPRGVGQSRPSIDCDVNQETQGVYAQPFERPETLDVNAMVDRDQRYIRRCVNRNRAILPYVSTANAARDLDQMRAAVGDRTLTYLGFSYGTFLGATYVSMFPHHARAVVLDGALDPDQYVHDPLSSLDEQTAGFERAIGRFLQACAAHQDACQGFGGDDPWMALDKLLDRANITPIPAPRNVDPRPVSGDDIDTAVVQAVYNKGCWPLIAQALAEAQGGDASFMRSFVDLFYGWLSPGRYDPITDRYFALSADEQRYPRSIQTYLKEGRRSYQDYPHAWWSHGYSELAWGLYPITANSVFDGPFRNPQDAATTLVVGTAYAPATPYKEAQRLTAQLGNARLLTMDGDGHTAYGGNSTCIDAAVESYVDTLALPAAGTRCPQDLVPFASPQAAPQQTQATPEAKALPQALTQAQQSVQKLKQLTPGIKPWTLR